MTCNIYDAGYGVRVQFGDGRCANFSYLAFPGEAWEAAEQWARRLGATVIEFADLPNGCDLEKRIRSEEDTLPEGVAMRIPYVLSPEVEAP